MQLIPLQEEQIIGMIFYHNERTGPLENLYSFRRSCQVCSVLPIYSRLSIFRALSFISVIDSHVSRSSEQYFMEGHYISINNITLHSTK